MSEKEKRKPRFILAIVALVLLIVALVLGLTVARMLERRTYRLSYPALIEEYAGEYELDPYLVAAMIHVESGNRPEVVSSAGAVGLMQVMPDTGEWINGKLQLNGYTADSLKTPDVNIHFGCWYLRFLLDRYEGDVDYAVAAYNAGQGTVDKWLSDPAVTENGELINIPYPETDNYLEKVQRAYEKYTTLYKDAF